MDHAILSPSASGRWLKCNRAPRLELQFPDSESDFAREGTLAHEIAETMLRAGSNLLTLHEWTAFKKREFYTEAMYEHVQDFVNYIYEHKSPNVKNWHSPERRVDLSNWIPEGFGSIDDPLIVGRVLHIFDLKFGKGVEVSAIDNTQLKIYSLGMLDLIEGIFEVDTVILHIFQPRLQNDPSTFEISVAELLKWGEEILKPNAKRAFAGEGDFVPGTHCQFCRANVECAALAEYCNETAKLRFEDHTLLSDEELMQIISRKKVIDSWLKAVTEFTLSEAINGRMWPGYKIVEGRAKRKYSDELMIERLLLTELHISNMHKPKELLNLEEMKKLIGPANFKKFIDPNLIKPYGKPTLVPESDKRPVFKDAAIAFADGFSCEDEEDYLN